MNNDYNSINRSAGSEDNAANELDKKQLRYVNTVDARKNLSEVVNSAAYGKQATILLRRKKPVVAIVAIKDFKLPEDSSSEPVHISTVSIRDNFSDLINQVLYSDKHLILTRHGKPICYIISHKEFVAYSQGLGDGEE